MALEQLVTRLYAQSSSAAGAPLPVLIVTGFLGAGKTSLVRHILTSTSTDSSADAPSFAIVANDLARLNVDGDVIQPEDGRELAPREGGDAQNKSELVVPFCGGCVCCTLRPDLLAAVCGIVLDNRHDYIIVEPTGIADAVEVAMAFEVDLALLEDKSQVPTPGESQRRSLRDFAYVDAVAAVVDASDDAVVDALDAEPGNFSGPLGRMGGLVREQVAGATTVILNKTDAASDANLARLRTAVKRLSPIASLVETQFSRAPVEDVLYTAYKGGFDFERDFTRAQLHARAERGDDAMAPNVHISEAEMYNVTSAVVHAPVPLDAAMVRRHVTADDLKAHGILRAKGVIWLDVGQQGATDDDEKRACKRARRSARRNLFSLAGGVVTLEEVGTKTSTDGDIPSQSSIALIGMPLGPRAEEHVASLFAQCKIVM